MALVGYAFHHKPHYLPKKYYGRILKFGKVTHEQVQKTFRSVKDPTSSVRLPDEPFVECSPTWHNNPSCLNHQLSKFLTFAPPLFKFYAAIHFLLPLTNRKLLKYYFSLITFFTLF